MSAQFRAIIHPFQCLRICSSHLKLRSVFMWIVHLLLAYVVCAYFYICGGCESRTQHQHIMCVFGCGWYNLWIPKSVADSFSRMFFDIHPDHCEAQSIFPSPKHAYIYYSGHNDANTLRPSRGGCPLDYMMTIMSAAGQPNEMRPAATSMMNGKRAWCVHTLSKLMWVCVCVYVFGCNAMSVADVVCVFVLECVNGMGWGPRKEHHDCPHASRKTEAYTFRAFEFRFWNPSETGYRNKNSNYVIVIASAEK